MEIGSCWEDSFWRGRLLWEGLAFSPFSNHTPTFQSQSHPHSHASTRWSRVFFQTDPHGGRLFWKGVGKAFLPTWYFLQLWKAQPWNWYAVFVNGSQPSTGKLRFPNLCSPSLNLCLNFVSWPLGWEIHSIHSRATKPYFPCCFRS